MINDVRRLLVFRFGQIGDTLAALPSLWLLRETFPKAHITLLSEVPQNGRSLPPEQVLPTRGLVDEFRKYQGGLSLAQLPSFASVILSLRSPRYDAVAYLAPTIRSKRQRQRDAMFFRLSGIRRSFGFEGFPTDAHPRGPDNRLLSVPREADVLLQRLALSGLPSVPPGQGRMDMLLSDQELAQAQDWLTRRAVPSGWFALCAGSKWSSKVWPEERFLELGRRLIADHGLAPVVVGGAEDQAGAERLIQAWGAGWSAAGEFSVRGSAALMRSARFYVGNDTGAMHLAAAAGTPCVGIFSSLDWPGRWQPYGEHHHVLRHEVPCSGCLLEHCTHDLQCLKGITVHAALAACSSVLDSTVSEVRTHTNHFQFDPQPKGDWRPNNIPPTTL
jgi:ADP-heptose:LPS heptosyltransferase